ncbi:hypothetical protein INE91_02649 [Phocaeicola vulgatus]|nr:hypothetical protein [Phocaeicola vulgatus]
MVRRALVHRDVHGVLRIILVHRRQELLLGQAVVLVRHADVPEDIAVAGLRYQAAARKLRVVGVRPDGDDLELARVAVEVHLEIIGAVLLLSKSGQLAALLEGDAFHLPRQLVSVGIERQRVVPEIVYRERIAVLARHLTAAHGAYRTHTTGVDAREGVRLVVVVNTVFVRIHVHVFRAAGKLQPAVPVFLRVDVPGAAHREQTRVELRPVGLVTREARQAPPVGQRELLAVLATAHVHRLPLDPPFSLGAHGFGDLLQRLVAVLPLVVDHDVLRTLHRAHLPVGNAAQPVVDRLHDQRHVFPRRGRQREHRLRIPVHHVQHQEPLDKALDAVELHVVFPLLRAHLLRKVAFQKPVALAAELHVVVHLQRHVLVQGEGERQDVVRLERLHLRRAVVRGEDRLLQPVAVIYR